MVPACNGGGATDALLANGEVNPKARYRNEHISLMDIKRANSQK